LALHLDCSRACIGKLEGEGVIQWKGDGFSLDRSRVAYCGTAARAAPVIGSELTLITLGSRPRCCNCG